MPAISPATMVNISMGIPDSQTFILGGSLANHHSFPLSEELTIKYQHSHQTTTFVLSDYFSQSICKSGAALVNTHSSLLLWQKNGALRKQQHQHSLGLVSELDEGDVKTALSNMPSLRSLLPLTQGSLTTGELQVTNEHNEVCAHAGVWTFESEQMPQQITFITLQNSSATPKVRKELRRYITLLNRTQYSQQNLKSNPASIYPLLVANYQQYKPRLSVHLAKKNTALQGASLVIHNYLCFMRHNEWGILADYDSEFLHDYRVSLRKIRTILSLFKGVYSAEQTTRLQHQLKQHMQATSALRDLDVYLIQRQQFYDLLPQDLQNGLTAVFEFFEQQRSQQYAKVIRYLRSCDYQTSSTKLVQLFAAARSPEPGPKANRTIGTYTTKLIDRRTKKLSGAARKLNSTSSAAELHQLRIQCKKLRYLVEFIQPTFSQKRFKKLLNELKTLQNLLGTFNDLIVQQKRLADLLTCSLSTDKKRQQEALKSLKKLILSLHQLQVEKHHQIICQLQKYNQSRI